MVKTETRCNPELLSLTSGRMSLSISSYIWVPLVDVIDIFARKLALKGGENSMLIDDT